MFATLSDRLTATFKPCAARAGCPTPTSTRRSARSGSRCSTPTSRCPWSATFFATIKERAQGAEVSGALNPAQQVVKIVNEELVDDPRRRDPPAAARQDPADGDHARGSAGCRQDHAGRQARRCWLQGAGPHPAAGGLRPAAARRRRPAADRRRARRRAVFAPHPGDRRPAPANPQRRGRPTRSRSPRAASGTRSSQAVRRRHRRHRRPARRRRRADGARPPTSATPSARRDPVRPRRDDRPGRGRPPPRRSATASASPASC